ncbi:MULTISPECIES: response regulator [unclassified Leptolyngbya]|uniref:response regulator n=1 Tax=unclassified Leptolyngbya TaxID=2650499 RepID=UPI0016844DD2|nr:MULTISPECIES: response regulator [unclassified Leptolyngbya]MBD1909345.1 response regulator [Leptolyngbya sp. FACHB-8]MBD2158121.1 response regulator [Leptolyngbya sp. FACHB-16]
MKLLLIEDDLAIGEILTNTLTLHHWVVERATDGQMGLEMAAQQFYDLILLDIGLPKLDGLTVCKRLRRNGYENPILLLTGQDSVSAQVAGLDAGADDYVTKPFDIDVLLARVRALVRKGKSTTLTWGTIQLDTISGEVTSEGKPVRLTAKEFSLLELFLRNPRHLYSRRAILDRLWNAADSPGEETVSTHIKCLRQKLKALGSADPIETVHGIGYRLRDPQTAAPSNLLEFPTLKTPEPPAPAPTAAQQKAQAVTFKVWNQFKTQYLEQIRALESLVTSLQPQADSPSQQQAIQQLAHKLVGSMGMFGLMEASQQAKQIEQLMQGSSLNSLQIQEARQRVGVLRDTIEQAQMVQPPKVQAPKLHSATSRPTASGYILIVDDDLLLAERLRIEAIAWDFQVEIANDLTTARDLIAQAPPRIILLDLNLSEAEDGLTLIRELERRSPPIPVIIMTAREDLSDRIAATRLGVSAFLRKPLPAYEILKTVTDVLSRKPPQNRGDRILIVDDDPGFLKLLFSLLAVEGVHVSTSNQPQTFWQALATCNPDVLILDLEMPEFNGIELCQVVRADPQWQHLKILFLSSHTEARRMAEAYAAGADDYISKSMSGPELVAQILHRLNRAPRATDRSNPGAVPRL